MFLRTIQTKVNKMGSFVRSQRIPVILSCVALLSALTLNIAAVPANAAQTVPISVEADYVLEGTDLTQIPEGDSNITPANGLICSGRASQERYELGFQGVLNMKNVWDKWREMRGLGALAASFKPELHPDKLTLIGEWDTSFTVDPQIVDIVKEKYTVEAVQARFDEANKTNGALFASFMRVQSVSFDDGVFTAHYKLQTKGSDGTYTDGILGGVLRKAGATPEKVFLPSLDDSLYVSRDKLHQLGQNRNPIIAAKPTVKGQIDVPRLTHIYAMNINEMRPIIFEETTGEDLKVATALRPYVVVEHQTNAPDDVAVPAAISAFDAQVELEVNADPDTRPLLPAPGQKIETTSAIWTYTGTSKNEDVCGKRTYVANWNYEKKFLNVTTIFESLDEGLALPKEIRDLLPQVGTVQRNAVALPAVAAFEPVRIDSDSSAGGKPTIWFFEGWSPTRIESVTEDVAFTGRWQRKLEVAPEPPFLKEAPQAGVEKTVEIPVLEGVDYTSERHGTIVTVKAVPQAGYAFALNAQTEWKLDVAASSPTVNPTPNGTQKSPLQSPAGKVSSDTPRKMPVSLAYTGVNISVFAAMVALLALAGGAFFFRGRR